MDVEESTLQECVVRAVVGTASFKERSLFGLCTGISVECCGSSLPLRKTSEKQLWRVEVSDKIAKVHLRSLKFTNRS